MSFPNPYLANQTIEGRSDGVFGLQWMDEHRVLVEGVLRGPILQAVATLQVALRNGIGMTEQMILKVSIAAQRSRALRTRNAECYRFGTFFNLMAGRLELAIVVWLQRNQLFLFLRGSACFLRWPIQCAQVGRATSCFLLFLLQFFQQNLFRRLWSCRWGC